MSTSREIESPPSALDAPPQFNHVSTPHGPAAEPIEPAEARTFSTGEMFLLTLGFALAGAMLAERTQWEKSFLTTVPGLILYAALGLALSGPPIVTWRERLGRRRAVWGVGESLWFAIGILAQSLTPALLLTRSDPGWLAALAPLLFVLLPLVYLNSNPLIERSRAPASWSNVMGILDLALWGLLVLSLPFTVG